MSGKRYTEAVKIDAVKQVTDRGYSVVEVADRLGISIKSLYAWKAKYGDPKRSKDVQQNQEQRAEIARLKAEVRRLTEERDILKKAGPRTRPHTSPKSPTTMRSSKSIGRFSASK